MLWRQFSAEEPWVLEWIRIPSDTCGRANSIWIRYVWTAKFLNPERKSCGFKNIRIVVDGGSVAHLKMKVWWYFLQNGFKHGESLQLHLIWRNVATRAKQMSSEILFVSDKTRRQFLQQKNPLPRSEPRWIVTWEVLRFPSHFLLLQTASLTTQTHLWAIFWKPLVRAVK